ncbi:hypothetical protein LguiA_005427 [Lonicera macranthoides]
MRDQMPFKPNSIMWSSCKMYNELELGREATYKLCELQSYRVVPYLTIANLYTSAGLWSEIDKMKRLTNSKGLRKSAGWSWIEIESKVHLSHSYTREIYVKLSNLNMEMKEAGGCAFAPGSNYIQRKHKFLPSIIKHISYEQINS